MRWLHARVYERELRVLTTAVSGAGERLPPPVVITCPRCGDEFFADLAPEDDAWELEADEWEALTRLDGECPDHAHAFVVGE